MCSGTVVIFLHKYSTSLRGNDIYYFPVSEYLIFIILVWPWLATKDRVFALLPLPLLGRGGEWKEKGKTPGSG